MVGKQVADECGALVNAALGELVQGRIDAALGALVGERVGEALAALADASRGALVGEHSVPWPANGSTTHAARWSTRLSSNWPRD